MERVVFEYGREYGSQWEAVYVSSVVAPVLGQVPHNNSLNGAREHAMPLLLGTNSGILLERVRHAEPGQWTSPSGGKWKIFGGGS